ncbi:MAG: hypothetical protein FH756_06015 [Firmicutes bacterium]|nr:hypothetical protein [Bacillota bacterium]
MAKCDRCRNMDIKFDKSLSGMYYECIKGVTDLKQVKDIENFKIECDKFDSKYIEYPLTINGIELSKEPAISQGLGCKTGDLIKVRPCAEEYQNKTFLGIYLGDIDIGLHASLNRDTKVLSVGRMHNPAIFVPEIKKIIYGCGSWWGKIKDENDLKDITDDDIDNVWYVKMLKNN